MSVNASEDGLEPLGEAPDITSTANHRPRSRRAGSLDDRQVEIIDTNETVLAVLVYPDGHTRLRTDQPLSWVAATLQILTDSVRARANEADE
ncbi:hypothetical protein SEA_SMURPH_51 [Mycobacterium phage Smurph]|uniref:Uncharacterized protein n=8 Tax=Charlievirus TaxID=1623280 RepID=A0A142K7X1_9CAUD|nr:hypothetical protein AVV74_gp51 [Mycobacterium phage Carcharodon]YP_009616904.1 hypothetical protein FDI84_gp51 [Mycobacterium phage Pipsqueaks]YP_010052187.1 hypothetical protein KD932_gp50 [Mycobacterium phage Fulbright]AMS01997.1 hypothetical protein SEA_XERXES_51 [Mycobacterium phage Xerxes]AWY04133.1 hypothetical protein SILVAFIGHTER_52 [Mycobacterium phage Silvafighter]AXQ52621.1 hypothetical protein SEA_GEX_51 [Mycobacterium phage Gex]AYQ98277.1 hypothetical protein SEA_CHEWBACCA_53